MLKAFREEVKVWLQRDGTDGESLIDMQANLSLFDAKSVSQGYQIQVAIEQ